MEDGSGCGWVDVAFALAGLSLPCDHASAIARRLTEVLPWLDEESGWGVHRVRGVHAEGERWLLSRRSKLVLRLPRKREGAASALTGSVLELCGHRLTVGPASVRELTAHPTLYAAMVAAEATDEVEFVESVERALAAMGVRGRCICGRHQSIRTPGGTLTGFSLMVDRLAAPDSLRVQQRGIGAHRALGCGLFVGHRSAVAVGAQEAQSW